MVPVPRQVPQPFGARSLVDGDGDGDPDAIVFIGAGVNFGLNYVPNVGGGFFGSPQQLCIPSGLSLPVRDLVGVTGYVQAAFLSQLRLSGLEVVPVLGL